MRCLALIFLYREQMNVDRFEESRLTKDCQCSQLTLPRAHQFEFRHTHAEHQVWTHCINNTHQNPLQRVADPILSLESTVRQILAMSSWVYCPFPKKRSQFSLVCIKNLCIRPRKPLELLNCCVHLTLLLYKIAQRNKEWTISAEGYSNVDMKSPYFVLQVCSAETKLPSSLEKPDQF